MLQTRFGWGFDVHQAPSEGVDFVKGGIILNQLGPRKVASSMADKVTGCLQGEMTIWRVSPAERISDSWAWREV